MLAPRRLVFRADGNAQIGLGHVMRLLALAEIASDSFQRIFITRADLPLSTQAEVRAVGAELIMLPPMPLAQEAHWLATELLKPTDTVVLDGYDFDFAYQTTIRAACGALVYLDDLVAFPQVADVVLNPAGGVDITRYDVRRAGAQVLTGPMWAPMRGPFRAAATLLTVPAPVGAVLLCLGGADLANRTLAIARQLVQVAGIEELHVAVGGAYSHYEELAKWVATESVSFAAQVVVHHALSADAFCELLQSCGSALLSASTVCYEYISSGGGLLTLIQTAENQRNIYEFMLREGLARPATALANMLSAPDRLHTQAFLRAAQRQHFDGKAPERLWRLLRSLGAQAVMRLRPATPADSDVLLQWANDPLVRQFSYNTAVIEQANHESWLAAKLANKHHLLLLAEIDGKSIGTIRFAFDVASTTATLSFLVAPEMRGHGLAAALLRHGIRAAAARWATLDRVVGHVQLQNEASQAAFRRAGFTERNDSATPADSVSFDYRLT